ncbi:glycerophosphodiester phosphodiesterase [Bradyrhizobium jicamae]|uniref:glycerophosphodiester phosphodiesterase family protein n=1 Tax=Bradyrhizobium jicamae TaxID=280332 RepID=UPI001BA87F45|nr:glycerophosphodiester phosphodiesterase family protein [Bradyrhizobium jicamae]MBR0753623.1 glycerophosphodiester phosphodiesterase [Bradyrhizobium jicamae]
MFARVRSNLFATLLLIASALPAVADDVALPREAQLGPRPFYLVDKMKDGPLKQRLRQCTGPFHKTDFSIGHRGAALEFPEHSRESYIAAARMGAGVIECDVTFTRDRQLVCRHSQCDLHTTTNVLAVPELASKCTQGFSPADPAAGKKATAKCCTSDFTLAEFKRLTAKMDGFNPDAKTPEEYQNGTPRWRTDLYARGTLMTHDESIALIRSLGAKFTPELKAPEVPMPFDGDYTQEKYASQMIAAYKQAGISAHDVFVQSFSLADILYWVKTEPEFAKQALYLEERYEKQGLDPNRPETWKPSMEELKAAGVAILGPPIWTMLTLNDKGEIVPSAYAKAAKAAGLDLIGWSLERDGPLNKGGAFYHKSVKAAIDRDGDTLTVLDVLTQQVGIRGMFSDWPATTTFYANCVGKD